MKDEEHLNRSDFIRLAAGAAVLMSGAVFLLPAARTLRLKPDVDWSETNVEFDITGIPEGEFTIAPMRSIPVLVRHRSPQEVAAIRAKSIDQLIDRDARLPDGPQLATDEARTSSRDGRFLVVVASCTHNGCVVIDGVDEAGFFCPCCASRYDLSGRVIRGPARRNLVVPEYRFNDSETTVFINSRSD